MRTGMALILALGLACAGTWCPQSNEAPETTRTFLLLGAHERLPTDLEAQVRTLGGTVTRTIPQIGVAVVTASRRGFLEAARELPGIEAVGADGIRFAPSGAGTEATLAGVGEALTFGDELAASALNPPDAAEDDVWFDAQWALDAVDAPEAWDTGERGAGATVFVLDSGITSTHPDIAPNLNLALCASFVPGEHFDALVTEPARPLPFFNHGTHVAGIVGAADNGVGAIGVAPEVELVAVKVLSQISGFGLTSWIADGIVYAADNGADVINMSLGGVVRRRGYLETMGTPDPSDDFWVTPNEVAADLNAFARAINYAHAKGVTVIVAAGNEFTDANADQDHVIAPAQLQNVIAVGATGPEHWALDQSTNLDVMAFYTNYGTSITDLTAPGGNIVFPQDWTPAMVGTRLPAIPTWAWDMVLNASPGGWFFAAGTSMAAPHASGVAALIISKHGGEMKPAAVYAALKASADSIGRGGRDSVYGHGRVNAYNAVK